jgi:hypothetical protein
LFSELHYTKTSNLNIRPPERFAFRRSDAEIASLCERRSRAFDSLRGSAYGRDRERVDALEAAHFDFAIAPNLKNRVLSSEVRPAG